MSEQNLQERYSEMTLAKLRSESIFVGLFNESYEGDPTAGAVKIPYRAEASVGDYDEENGGSLNLNKTQFKTLLIDHDKYVNELIDGYSADCAPDNVVAERIDSAGYAMGNDTDTALAALLKDKGTVLEDTTALTKGTVYESMVDAATMAKKAKVRKNELWFAISADTSALLTKSDDFVKATTGDVEAWGEGFVGKIDGIPCFESLNLPDDVEYILGNRVYCAYVAEWAVPVDVKDIADGKHIGASAVQGRQVWGADVTEETSVIVKTAVVTP